MPMDNNNTGISLRRNLLHSATTAYRPLQLMKSASL